MDKEYTFEDFKNIIARLRGNDGCPWDRVQTHESLRDCMIEEAYEAAEGLISIRPAVMMPISAKSWEMCCFRWLCMHRSGKRKAVLPWRMC